MGRIDVLPRRLAAWAAAPAGPARLGIRPVDVAAAILVGIAVELNNAVASGPHQRPLNALAYAFGAVVAVPILIRHRWPRAALIGCSLLLLLFYSSDQRDISPAPLLCLPLYDAAAAGALALSIVVPVFYMGVGIVLVGSFTHASVASLTSEFLPSAVVLLLAVLLGGAMRSRRELAVQTAERLRLAAEERDAEGARRAAEERLRIARELHDTVAHSMATIAVQAAAALQLLGGREAGARGAVSAIRETSKEALADIRVTLGELRAGDGVGDGGTGTGTLSRLDELADAVRAAGAPVTVVVEGEPGTLPPAVDHCAYRILQESLTNVLRHAGPAASAAIVLRYDPAALGIEVTDDGAGDAAADAGTSDPRAAGHGLTGMAERVRALGGTLRARPLAGNGFEVIARLPIPAAQAAAGVAEAR